MQPSAYFTSLAANTLRFGQQLTRDKTDTLLLMAACVLALAPHALHLAPWATLACLGALAWRAWLTISGRRMPPRWILLPLAVLAMAGVYATFQTVFGRDAGVTMLVLLLAFKMLEMHARRDLFVVVMLSYFLMLTNFFYAQGIGAAAMMTAAVILMLTAQLSFQFTGKVPPLRHRLRMGAGIFLLSIPLMLVLFVLFPRIQGPLWGLPGDAQGGRSGLSDSMSPGNISSLALSEEVAFRVKFFDPAPAQAQLYWRGVVFGNFDGRTWTPLMRRLHGDYPVSVQALSPPIRHQVTLEPNGQRWLFALETPRFAPLVEGNPSILRSDLQLLALEPIRQRVRYDVASSLDYQAEKSTPVLLLQDWLELPPGFNPRTHAFAAELRRHASSQAELVNQVLVYFRSEKFSYTLEPPPLGKDGVDDFLFTTRAGFCEHYSSAFVILMRALNIPARVVTGYQGGEINPVDGMMTVRQSDAHAWAEVWLENQGWVRVDPTAAVAPERISKNLTSAIPRRNFGGLINLNFGKDSWIHQLKFNLSAITSAWNQWVLNYTPDKQKSLLQSLGFKEADWRTLIMLMATLGVLVMALVLLSLIWQRRQTDPVNDLYANFCRVMARYGMARHLHEGPRAYARRIASLHPLTFSPNKQAYALQFLQLYEQMRYGQSSPVQPQGPVPPMRDMIATLKTLLTNCK